MESVVDGNGGGSRLVMTELSRIKELVKQLDVQLGGCPDLCKNLAAQIVTVTEKSIGMIMSGHFHGPKRSAADAGIDSPATPSSPGGISGMPKKRKMMEKGERRVRLSSVGGAETTVDDGFSWRKYGQKKILGAQHPRAYYRCTYRKTQGCAAIKQVQRADEDPTLYDVTYHGTHTCLHQTAAAATKVQPETPNPDGGSLLQSLSSSLTVNTEGLTPGPQQSTPFSFSSPAVSCLTPPPEHYTFFTSSTPENCFGQGVSLSPSQLELSPATSDWSYIPMNPFEDDLTIASPLVSATSMPDTAFFLDELFDPNFDVSFFFAEM